VESEVVMKVLAVVVFGLLSVANAKEVIAPGTQITINPKLSFLHGGFSPVARVTNGVEVQTQGSPRFVAFVGCDVAVFPSTFVDKAKDIVFTVQPTKIKSHKGHILQLKGMWEKQPIDLAILCQREKSNEVSTASYDLDLIETHLKDLISVKRLIIEDEGRPETRRQITSDLQLDVLASARASTYYIARKEQAEKKGQKVELNIIDESMTDDDYGQVCTRGTDNLFVKMNIKEGNKIIFSTYFGLTYRIRSMDSQYEPCADTSSCPVGRIQMGSYCG